MVCRTLEFASAALIAALIALVAATGWVQVGAAVIDIAVLIVVMYTWVTVCRPTWLRRLRAFLIGALVGIAILLMIIAFGP